VLILLPPSEHKRDGGAAGTRLDLASLGYPSLNPARRKALAGVRAVSRNIATATVALRLGPTQRFEIQRNREITRAPLLPAMDRYAGVLYDALDAPALDAPSRAFLTNHVAIASALFGLVGAGDGIPAYRLSFDSRLPDVKLKALWSAAISSVLADHDGLILDCRSEGYVALGPVPRGSRTIFLRVVTRDADGTRRALNHLNKSAKGALVRAIALNGQRLDSVDDLLAWSSGTGIELARGREDDIELVV
jgi:hypothetical protein